MTTPENENEAPLQQPEDEAPDENVVLQSSNADGVPEFTDDEAAEENFHEYGEGDSEDISDDAPLEDHDGTYSPVSTPSVDQRSFEDLTLAEVIGQFFRQPAATYRAVVEVASTTVNFPQAVAITATPISTNDGTSTPVMRPHSNSERRLGGVSWQQAPEVEESTEAATIATITHDDTVFIPNVRRQWMQLGMYVSAFVLAFWGCLILVSAETRFEAAQLQRGTPFLIAGFLIWVGAEIYRDWPNMRKRLQSTRKQKDNADIEQDSEPQSMLQVGERSPAEVAYDDYGVQSLIAIHPIRIFAGVGMVAFGVMAWIGTQDNQFTTAGFWAWMLAIITVVVLVAPRAWALPDNWSRLSSWHDGFRIRVNWVVIALVGIFLVGAFFRINDLSGVPPEMTSDHIEKLLDSQRVVEGDRDVFFTNNGGREGFQMYAMALLSQLPGLGVDFSTLKLLAVIESLVTLPILFWLGREIVGERYPQLGNIVGLMLMALVAVSYWHVAVTRLSLRIVLTPLVMSLLLIFLSRGMRYNRRGDYIIAGLVLGFGLYMYQAVRMMPLVVLAGVGIAFLYRFSDPKMRMGYVRNLAVLVLVSFIVFIPLFRFSVDYPDDFWRRTAGRLLGDDVIQAVDENGNIYERNATIGERLGAFSDNIPVLTSNMRNALLMFNWKGDVAWINGVPNYPHMDSFTGAFLIVGVAAWFAMTIRQRDPVYLLIPMTVLIMLLPSALSIAAPLENPSATRASGAIPPAYLIAALPLSLVVLIVARMLSGRVGQIAATGIAVIVIGGAYVVNSDTYFNDYLESYDLSWTSHSDPGQVLRGFAQSDGDYGNAFLIHYPHWLDHRIVGAEAGILDWPNGIADFAGYMAVEIVPDFLADAWDCGDPLYPLDPEKDLLFFVNMADTDSIAQLQEWFPQGRERVEERPDPRDGYRVYRVPALGEEALDNWIEANMIEPRCRDF